MYDSPEERERVVDLFARYQRESWSPAVMEGFRDLARERAHRHRLRTYLLLPLARALRLYLPSPEYELPMRVPWLGLPMLRGLYDAVDQVLLALAVVGGLVLFRAGAGSAERRLAWLLVSVVAARTVLVAWLVPTGVIGRLRVETIPHLAILAAWAPLSLRRWRRAGVERGSALAVRERVAEVDQGDAGAADEERRPHLV
jgi:hypothetical protein